MTYRRMPSRPLYATSQRAMGCCGPAPLSGPLTEWACDSGAHTADWQSQLGAAMSTGATAAVIGAGAAGLIGGLLKRPLLGTFLGAATGWAAHAIWTAPMFSGD